MQKISNILFVKLKKGTITIPPSQTLAQIVILVALNKGRIYSNYPYCMKDWSRRGKSMSSVPNQLLLLGQINCGLFYFSLFMCTNWSIDTFLFTV